MNESCDLPASFASLHLISKNPLLWPHGIVVTVEGTL